MQAFSTGSYLLMYYDAQCHGDRFHFPVIKSLTILPKIVIPKMSPIGIARKTAKIRVNLKTR